jgi:hypothetical protein
MAFILAEDKALRDRLQGITVYDQKSEAMDEPRTVGVFFGQPDQEIRAQVYPYITIDLVDINRDMEREMRGKTHASYLVPSVVTLGANDSFETDLPIPVSLDYQITAYSRHPLHDRVMMAQLLYSKLPFRFGYLEITEKTVVTGQSPNQTTTNTNTYRRLDVLDVAKRDMVEAGKRLFMNAVTVRVSSEIPQDTYRKLVRVQEARIAVSTKPNISTKLTENITITD